MAGTGGKRILVRVVARAADGWTESVYREHRVDGEHTVQEAVRAEYAAFPGACVRVGVRRAGALLGEDVWERDEGADAFWRAELYDAIVEGDEVDIVVAVERPGGPRQDWPGRGAGGAQAARVVSALLRRLEMCVFEETALRRI